MVQVKCSCGRVATMSHPGDWVCQCQVEALYKEFDKVVAALKRREACVVPYVGAEGAVVTEHPLQQAS